MERLKNVVSETDGPNGGDVWVDGFELQFCDDDSDSTIRVVERRDRLNAPGGYAGLGEDGRIAASQAPARSVYAMGGEDPLTPNDIGAEPLVTMLPISKGGTGATTAVGALASLGAVSLEGGTLSGDLAMGGHRITGLANASEPTDAATYGQIAAMLNGLDWQRSVLDKDLSSPPPSPDAGDRYIVADSATAGWSGHTGDIAEWTGSAWAFVSPNQGFTVHVEDEGRDYNFNGIEWVNLGTSIDHANLLNLAVGDPHPQYQQESEKDENGGYAGLDGAGLVIRPVRAVRVSGEPTPLSPGDVWIEGPDLKFRDNQGTPTTHAVESQSRRNAVNGYAGLDGTARVPAIHAPARSVYSTAGDQALAPSDIGAEPTITTLPISKGGTGATTVAGALASLGVATAYQATAERGQANGYASLDAASKVVQQPAAHASSHAVGGADPVTPAAIGAVPTTRAVGAGAGLTGGGDLSANRTLSIAAYSGLFAKDIDPPQLSWVSNEVKTHQTWDATANGHFVPISFRLPATVHGSLENEIVFEFDDTSTKVVSNAATGANLDETMQGIADLLAGNLSQGSSANGRSVRKISFRTRNKTGSGVDNVNVGVFRVRAYVFPRGGGSSL